jgi:hypothetical protein
MLNQLFGVLMHPAGTMTWDGVWRQPNRQSSTRPSTRTGGPNDDDDEAALVRKLMPIVAIIIVLAVVFGR